MKSQWFSIVTLLAALLLWYAFINRDDGDELAITASNVTLGDYFLKDAVIVETDDNGAMRVRYSAATATQAVLDGATTMNDLRIDYAARRNARSNGKASRWLLTANTARRAAQSDAIELAGDVRAQSLEAANRISLATESLRVDVAKQSAASDDVAEIDVGEHNIVGRGLAVDLPRRRVRLQNDVRIRLAALPDQPADSPKLQLPEIFESDSGELFSDGSVLLRNVRSKTEPFLRADEALATGADAAFNRFTLRGAVRIDLPQQGYLQADSVIVTVQDNRIVRAIASGADAQPVQFEHQMKPSRSGGDAVARGHAQRVEYDVPANLLTFKTDVLFTRGNFEWRGDEFNYNLTSGAAKIPSRSTGAIKRSGKPGAEPKQP